MPTRIARRRLLGTAVAGLAAGGFRAGGAAAPLPLAVEGPMPPLAGASAWLNSPPLATEALRGKVVLVDFCTYTCIYWRRTLPYVREWNARYRDRGLVVVGVHTPEFGFEHDLANVRWAVQDMAMPYPVAVDNERAIWRAFRNDYWPALYLADAQGRVRHHWFGEGDYERSERAIRHLLAEAGAGDPGGALAAVDPQGFELGADWQTLKSPETYVDVLRTRNFASPESPVQGQPRDYSAPRGLRLNEWALAGRWTMGDEATVLRQAGGRIAFRFHARDLHLVLGRELRAAPVRFRVLVDGAPPGPAHGLDIDANGQGQVLVPRLYQLVRQRPPIADRLFEIEFLDPAVQAFAFTFG